MGSGSERNIEAAKAGSRDFGDVNPAHRTPAPLEERGEEVDADEGDITGR